MTWILADRGKTPVVFFEKWTGIGPCGTWDIDKAARFTTEAEAMRSPAFSFAFTFYRPERVA